MSHGAPRHVVGLAMTLAAVFSALMQRPLRRAVAEQSSATKALVHHKRDLGYELSTNIGTPSLN